MGAPTIGHEEWASELEAQRDWRRDRWGRLQHQARRAPSVALVGLTLVLGNDYILRVGGTACSYGILALGLALVVGQAGLLDLGYVAYFGVGAYAYALLTSSQLGLHTPMWLALPAAVGAAVLAGLLLGIPGLRLNDDYLGIVTLGFGQVIILLALKLDRVALPWLAGPLDLTGGPNGILGIEPPRLLGWAPATQRDWLLTLATVLLAVLALAGRVVDAPLGRTWRALREDPLAAAALGLPVTRLRLLAVSCGAAIAGLAGALFAGWQGAVFPVNLDLSLLLTLYAAILIGGMGSLPGALVGAALLAMLPELLRDPALGRVLVYGGGALALLVWRRRLGAALLGAGKTTALNLISGLGRPTGGAIRLEGRPLAGLAPAAISRLGIARTFQSLRLFLNMSVLENLTAVGYRRGQTNTLQAVLRTPAFRREASRWRARAEELLALFGSRLASHRYDQPAYSLSYANRRRLEIARALMTGAKLLLLDEPAAGMNPHETDELAGLIATLPERFDLAVLLIEHDMGLVEGVADRVVALDNGARIAEGSFAEVVADERVATAYLGRRVGIAS